MQVSEVNQGHAQKTRKPERMRADKQRFIENNVMR
jgi:hypothetical protein